MIAGPGLERCICSLVATGSAQFMAWFFGFLVFEDTIYSSYSI
jgi:hypothetical protein